MDNSLAAHNLIGLHRHVRPRSYLAGTPNHGYEPVAALALIFLYFAEDDRNSEKIDLIDETYKQAFHQESVLRADSRSCLSFLNRRVKYQQDKPSKSC